jgi:hypothetical protein
MIIVTIKQFSGYTTTPAKLLKQSVSNIQRDEVLNILAKLLAGQKYLITGITDEEVLVEQENYSGPTKISFKGSVEDMAILVRLTGFVLAWRQRWSWPQFNRYQQIEARKKLSLCQSWEGCDSSAYSFPALRGDNIVKMALMLASSMRDKLELQVGLLLELNELLWVLHLTRGEESKYSFIERCSATSPLFDFRWKQAQEAIIALG